MKDTNSITERCEIAATLREIRGGPGNPDYNRAFCRCVLTNFRMGMVAVPRQSTSGQWFPCRRNRK